jgi:thiamine biosynthesis lipoprotein
MPSALLLTAALQVAALPAREPVEVRRALFAMGTRLELTVAAPTRAEALAASEAALVALEAVEARLSTWRPESELSALNAAPVGEPRPLSPELGGWLARARDWRERSGGAFDPAVGPLVDAWDLRGDGRRPSPAALRRALEAAAPGAWELDGLPHAVTRRHAEARLEEGGFGKGAGLDAALGALARAGVRSAELDLGGQVAVLGEAPRTFAIAHPDDRERAVVAVTLTSGSLATSGNSERGIVVDGERLGHLLDPRTGLPAPDAGSVTVRAASALDADCLSTCGFALGPEGALALAARHEGVDALVLERCEGGALRVRATRGLEGALRLLEEGLLVEWYPPIDAAGSAAISPSPVSTPR